MGSFYATCSLSNTTITDGQRCYIQLLVPAWGIMANELGSTRGLLVSNHGSQMFFAPFGFPILGEYADYGDIDNIVRDANVEMLEAYFGKGIDEVLQHATQGGEGMACPDYDAIKAMKGTRMAGVLDGEQTLTLLNATYFRAEVADYLMQGKVDYWFKEHGGRIIRSLPETLLPTEYGAVSGQEVDELLGAKEQLTDLQLKVLMASLRMSRREQDTYIDSLTSVNMFQALPITKDFTDQVYKQYVLLSALTMLRRHLLPSAYGSQQDNYQETLAFNVAVNKLLREDRRKQREE